MSKKLMRKKLALMLANLKKKRPFYTEIEYLESTGTQYINTGITGTTTTMGVDVEWMFSNDSENMCIFSSRSGQTSNTFTLFWLKTSQNRMRFDANGQKYFESGVNTVPNQLMRFTYKSASGAVATLYNLTNGTSQTETIGQIPTVSSNNLYLFQSRDNGSVTSSIKMYYFKLYDGDTLLRDMIPVLDWDMTPCMYDRVTEQLFYNQGTGDFVAGRQIHPVEYLESTGTQYIDTGYAFNSNTDEIVVEYENSSTLNHKWLFGEYESNANFGVTSYQQSGSTIAYAYKGIIEGSKSEQYDTKHTLVANSDGLYNDGVKKSNFKSYTATWNIYLFALNLTGTSVNGYFGYGKIYSYTHKRNGSLIRDYIPAIDENGVGYLFDRVSHTIYDNAGTGAFSYPAREVEYIQSTGTQYIDTGIQPTDAYGYKVEIMQIDSTGEQCPVGCMDSGNRFVGTYFPSRNTGTATTRLSYGWGASVSQVNYTSYNVNQKAISTCNYKNDRKIIFNNFEVFDMTSVQVSGTISNTVHLFNRHYTSTAMFVGRMYSAEITNGTDVAANYIPVFLNGSAGMLDKVNNVFYQNAGTGDGFTAGKIVEPEYE